MAIFKPYKIQSSQLEDLPVVEGQFIATTDTQKLYLDKDNTDRIELCDTDLTGYVKNTDYASSNTGGVIKTASSKATSVSSGVLQADTKTYSDYTSGGNDMFIGKGTLENVLTGKGYTTNTGTITGVSVNGTSVATSGVANITSVPASILTGSIPSAVTATTQSQGDGSTKVATTAYVDTAISNLPDPMVFKGSLGTGGTITALPVDGSANVGDTYKVITAGTYASKAADVGDTFICLTKTSSANTWELIPSGDEPNGTVTSVTLQATTPILIDDNTAITTSGTRTFTHATSGVTAGTYNSVTVDTYGHVTAGSNPTTLSGYGITDASISDQTVTLGADSVTVPTKTSELTNDANFMSGMTILRYGTSTWQDFITAYTANHVVYCRASSNANPASGSQTRLAFMAYVNNAETPTNVEFQYYRSVSSHSDSQQGDQVYVYKLENTSGGKWTVTVRESYTKVVGGTSITGTWSNGAITLNHNNSGVTAGTYKSVTVDAQGHVTAGTNPTTLSGYGITDAKIENGTITLGSNTITPLTSYTEINSNLVNGSATGSLRGIGTDTEDSSYTIGDYAFAVGNHTKASGDYSHAEGYWTIASGDWGSHAEGSGTIASGQKTHAEGEYTTAASNYQHVQGRYNIVDSNSTYLDIIGNGTADNARSNAATVDWSGNAWYQGDVYVGSTSGTNKDAGSKKLATEDYVDVAVAGVTIQNASSTVVGGLKVRLDENTHTLYVTNNGQDA